MIFKVKKVDPQIYTTGAYLRPLKTVDSEGNEMWVWYVEKFEGDDSFKDDEIYNPVEVANSLEKLLVDATAEVEV
ncbi:MAG: hypothetical protein LBT09_05790 [Planctomycetaceae bacterium]|jgi:hypothetical protein|nr:hypothetical protein [Planctomycetaceae bacterium]